MSDCREKNVCLTFLYSVEYNKHMIHRNRIRDVIELRLEYFRELYGEISEEEEFYIWRNLSKYFDEHRDKDCFPLLAEYEGKPVACAILCICEMVPTRSVPEGRYAEICGVYTKPEFRGRGFATQLVETAIALAAGKGVPFIDLTALPQGVAIYEKCGFKHIDINYTEMRFDLWNTNKSL